MMKDKRNLKARDARDRMIRILGIGTPYPLRDPRLDYRSIVSVDHPEDIKIPGGQAGVRYQVCDEDGNPIKENGKTFEVKQEGVPGEQGIVLRTPKIVKDITFTILASREHGKISLETYLNQNVSIKAGIDTTLKAAFQPAERQVITEDQKTITVNYRGTVRVRVAASQEGVSYVLVPESGDGLLSSRGRGTKGDIELVSKAITEDIELKVKASRTARQEVSANLDTPLSVKVRPNPAAGLILEAPIIDYRAKAVLSIPQAQSSVEYELYSRELVPSDYVSGETEGCLEIHTDEGRTVFVKAPEWIAGREEPSRFVRAGQFKKRGGKVTVTTDNLREDTLFIVRAAKKANRETLQLDQSAVVLVRPDRSPRVSVKQSPIYANTAGMVLVGGTQKGVAYQLRSEGRPINSPGFHHEDRGVETTRIEVDFIVESRGNPLLHLPTKRMRKKRIFDVLATKILTGVSAILDVTAEIDVRSE